MMEAILFPIIIFLNGDVVKGKHIPQPTFEECVDRARSAVPLPRTNGVARVLWICLEKPEGGQVL